MADRGLLIAGVDEAGRGPLAGPVVAAAVVLEQGAVIDGVRDSKKLSAPRRELLYDRIRDDSLAWAVGIASVQEIDELNILGATMLAMRRALAGLAIAPAWVRIDGNQMPDVPYANVRAECLVRGDDRCPAIGAASILAKVHRDRIMLDLHEKHPGYGFDRHKGYPTKSHRQALRDLGATPHHRRSFKPVREALAGGGTRSEAL